MKKEKIVKEDIGLVEDLFELCKNLCSIEAHALGSYISTKDEKWLKVMQKIRIKRTRYLSLITKNEGQSWCISKHICESTMRLQECATRFLSTNQLEEAKICAEDEAELYIIFLLLNGFGGEDVSRETKTSA